MKSFLASVRSKILYLVAKGRCNLRVGKPAHTPGHVICRHSRADHLHAIQGGSLAARCARHQTSGIYQEFPKFLVSRLLYCLLIKVRFILAIVTLYKK